MIYYIGVSPGTRNDIRHHGILGMRWGQRNGPPYPLGAEDHSKAEKKAGWRKSIDIGSKESDNKKRNRREVRVRDGKISRVRLTDGQKRALKIGAAVAVTGLAVYGAYKMGAFDKLKAAAGKSAAKKTLDAGGDLKLEDLNKQFFAQQEKFANLHARDMATSKNLAKPSRISESIDDTLKNVNPLRGKAEDKNSCVAASIAGVMRRLGYDVTNKGTGRKQINMLGAVEECFKIADRDKYEMRGSPFAKSVNDARQLLTRKYGENAFGICNVLFRNDEGGHAFMFIIKNGRASFVDPRFGWNDSTLVNRIWTNGKIDPEGFVQIARLDNITEEGINFEVLRKYLNFA